MKYLNEKPKLTDKEITALKTYKSYENDIETYIKESHMWTAIYRPLADMGLEKFVKAFTLGYEPETQVKSHLEAEKVRQKWATIGRNVEEFIIGDIFIGGHGDNYRIGNGSESISLKTAIEWMRKGDFKGLYPVESYVSFKEDETHE